MASSIHQIVSKKNIKCSLVFFSGSKISDKKIKKKKQIVIVIVKPMYFTQRLYYKKTIHKKNNTLFIGGFTQYNKLRCYVQHYYSSPLLKNRGTRKVMYIT